MNKARIGINGFGRVGRQVLKAILETHSEQLEVVAINDLFDTATNAHLLKYDTNYRRFPHQVEVKSDKIIVEDWEIASFAERDPSQIPWRDLGVDIVLESTGIFRTGPKAGLHIQAGAKKVIISAPAKQEDITVVLGVNEQDYDPSSHHIISNASCTTNCLAPAVKVVQDHFGIDHGTMTTVHAYTNDQRILDLPHKDLRRARAAACNIIPTTTGAAKAVALVIPELKGKIDGFSLRVPTPTVSVVDCTLILEKSTSTQDYRKAFEEASQTNLKGILAYTREPMVSSDFIAESNSCVIDEEFTMIMGGSGKTAKMMAWYDNEWGYACRLADMAAYVAKKGL
ncbi:type I glyceraldehyde-3-phosphate dehydrogenase [Desulfonatronovibrio hydrogenovorans]|uniref:type I glyceraldehyde-3-phosphate dehydrogenase n=1 Tax=Desulfonatronovibrio hydrogenovorans TaxID=53245 RepID=UPI000490CE9F|nr:type I glyceraldehyde-3-phosphate dehydrogenase [Desulfonatronovibrio hydrogenovorans]